MKIFSILTLTLLTGCLHKPNYNLYLVKWKNGYIYINDLNSIELNNRSFKSGKMGLTTLLTKKTFRLIFKNLGKKYNVSKSSFFINEWSNKKTRIKTEYYKNQIIKSYESQIEAEINEHIESQLDSIEATKLYDIYINEVKCKNEDECLSNLNQELINHDFKSLSTSKNDNISGYYIKIPKYNLLKSIQKHIVNLEHGQTSKPIQITDQKYIFVMLESISPASPYDIEKYKKLIKKRLYNKRSQSILKSEKANILSTYPQLSEKSDDEIFAFQANQFDFSKDQDLQLKLSLAYDWMIAEHGFNAHYSNNINLSEIKDLLNQEINLKYIFTRYNLEMLELDENLISSENIVDINKFFNNKMIENKKHLNQITQLDFNKSYFNSGIELSEIESNKWIGPISYQNKVIWIKKSYQGLATDDQILQSDYLIYKRNYISSVDNFMKEIGNDINLKFNPIIYSSEWPDIAIEFLDENNQ